MMHVHMIRVQLTDCHIYYPLRLSVSCAMCRFRCIHNGEVVHSITTERMECAMALPDYQYMYSSTCTAFSQSVLFYDMRTVRIILVAIMVSCFAHDAANAKGTQRSHYSCSKPAKCVSCSYPARLPAHSRIQGLAVEETAMVAVVRRHRIHRHTPPAHKPLTFVETDCCVLRLAHIQLQ